MKHLPTYFFLCFLFLAFTTNAQTLSISNTASICAKSSTTLQANYSGPSAASYSWTFASGVSSSSNSGTLVTITSTLCGTISFSCSAYSSANALLASATGTLLNVCSSLSISPASQTLCGISNLTLTANANTTYSWSTGASTQSIVITPTSSASYSLFNASSICPATASITVFNIQTLVSSTSVCPNTSFTMAAAAAGSPSYNWFQPPSTLMTGGTSAQVVTSTSVFPVTYTVYGIFPSNCILSKLITIQALTYSPTAIYPSSVCAASNFTMSGLNVSSYTWTSASQSLQASSFITSQSVVSTYTLRADSSTCNGQRIIQVGMHPIPSLTITASNATICPGQSSQLFASGAATYTWNTSPFITSPLNANSVTVTPSFSSTFSVTGTSTAGCSGTTSKLILVGAFPIITVVSSATAVCAGYNATITLFGPPNSYTWVALPNTSTVIGGALVAGVGNYTVIGSNGGSCITTETISIALLPPVQLSVTSSASQTCFDEQGNVKPVSLTVAGANSYTWMPYAPGQMSYSLGPSTMVSPTVSTCYTVLAETSNCSNTAVACVNFSGVCTGLVDLDWEKTMRVYPNPATSELHIQSDELEIEQLKLFMLNGALIYSDTFIAAHEVRIDVSGLPVGLYFMQVKTDKGFKHIKVQKE